jgi:hypothetical protein
MKSQMQIFYEEQRKIGEANQTFMELVKEGLTREELARNIARRPVLWSRFTAWLDQLPSASGAALA